MKKFLFKISIFAFSVPLFWFLSVGVWGFIAPTRYQTNIIYKRGAYGHMYSRMQEADNFGSCDVLVLGSSHAYRGFDPRIFKEEGFTMFNMGSSSQTPLQTQILVDEFVDQLQPKKVLWEIYPRTFELDGVESSLDIMSNCQMNLKFFLFGLKSLHLKVINTTIHSAFQQLLTPAFQEGKRKKNDTYISGGYVEKDHKVMESAENYDDIEVVFSVDQKQAFEEVIALLKSRDIEVYLVYAPLTKTYYQSIQNNEEIDAYFNSIKGTHYYNFNEFHVNFDTIHFYDNHHMNQSGVELFNEELLKIIE